jgi:FixJ family two-component response regulator
MQPSRVASGLTGKSDVERRAVLRDVRTGSTVTSKGVAKTQLSRAEKLAKALALVKSWTQDQRDQYIVSEKFEALTDRQQELMSEAITEAEDREYEDSIGIENIDLDAETPTVDSIIGEEDDTEDEVVDDSDFDAMFEQATWEAEPT